MAQERPGAPRRGPGPPRSAQEWARSAQEWLRNAQERPGPAQERPGATQERPRPPPRPGRPVSGPPRMPTATGKRMRNRRKRAPAARTGAPDPPGVRGDRFFPDGLRGVPRRDSGQVRTKSAPNPYNADPGGRSERPVVPGGKQGPPRKHGGCLDHMHFYRGAVLLGPGDPAFYRTTRERTASAPRVAPPGAPGTPATGDQIEGPKGTRKHCIRSAGGPRSKQKHVLLEFAGFGGTRNHCTLGTRDPRPAVKTRASRIPGGRIWPNPS